VSARSTLLTYTAFQFRAEWKATFFWTIGLSLYAGLVVSIYPSVRTALNLDAIPANMRAAFNITDFTQLAGFLSSQLFGVILPLVLPFYGIVMLSNVVAGAEERGRLDILLGNPIPRAHLVIGTFIVATSYLLGMVVVFGGVVWGMAALLDLDLTIRQALRATFVLWPTSLVFGAVQHAQRAGGELVCVDVQVFQALTPCYARGLLHTKEQVRGQSRESAKPLV